MAGYLIRRLVQAVLILLGVSVITFFLLYVLPADPVRQIAGRSATSQTVENIRACRTTALLIGGSLSRFALGGGWLLCVG